MTVKNLAAASKISVSDYIRQSITQSDIKVNNSKDIFALIGSVNKKKQYKSHKVHTLNVANKNNNLNDIDYNNIIDSLLLIEYQLKRYYKEHTMIARVTRAKSGISELLNGVKKDSIYTRSEKR